MTRCKLRPHPPLLKLMMSGLLLSKLAKLFVWFLAKLTLQLQMERHLQKGTEI
jgi:hypothetical protein